MKPQEVPVAVSCIILMLALGAVIALAVIGVDLCAYHLCFGPSPHSQSAAYASAAQIGEAFLNFIPPKEKTP